MALAVLARMCVMLDFRPSAPFPHGLICLFLWLYSYRTWTRASSFPASDLIFVPRCYSVLTFKNTRAGFPGNEVTDYPEGYNATISGPSGNITVNGIYTFNQTSNHTGAAAHGKRELMLRRGAFVGIDAYVTSDAYGPEEIDTPPYAIHNGEPLLYLARELGS